MSSARIDEVQRLAVQEKTNIFPARDSPIGTMNMHPQQNQGHHEGKQSFGPWWQQTVGLSVYCVNSLWAVSLSHWVELS